MADVPVISAELQYLHCLWCGKQVSTGFWPAPTDTPDGGLIVRAVVVCPECIPSMVASQDPALYADKQGDPSGG